MKRHFQIKNARTHAHKKGDLVKQNGNLVPAKGPSINYVVSKSAIFDPLPPLSHLFTK